MDLHSPRLFPPRLRFGVDTRRYCRKFRDFHQPTQSIILMFIKTGLIKNTIIIYVPSTDDVLVQKRQHLGTSFYIFRFEQ